MATHSLPEQPSLEQLRRQARELQRSVRTGHPKALDLLGLDRADPAFALTAAQFVVARSYGFPSWPRLKAQVDALRARSWTPEPAETDEPLAEEVLRFASVYTESDSPARRATADELLAAHADLTATSLPLAAASADLAEVARQLAADPQAARRRYPPFGWSPVLYLAYTRLTTAQQDAVATMRLLLRGGADPDDGRFFRGLPTPFTVLTGLFGGGEDDPPPHAHAEPLARLLLRRGADANDGQTLYNRMFGLGDDFLEVLLDFGLGRGDGGPWRRLLPDLIPAPAEMVRSLLEWAIIHDQRDRVALLVSRGVDVTSPMPGGRRLDVGGSGVAPIDVALRNGHQELADLLVAAGATPRPPDPVDSFITAALTGDHRAIASFDAATAAAARRARPSLINWATSQQRPEAVDVLLRNGFDVNAMGRADIPREEPWQTALHTAVERRDAGLVRQLLAAGADRTVRDHRFHGTPADWARHFDDDELTELLEVAADPPQR